MNNFAKRLEVAANVCIILVAIAIGIVLARDYFKKPAAPARLPQISVGERLNLSGAEWAKNGRTLVLALNTGCHFCTDSAAFYRRLAEKASNDRGIHLIAAFPQTQDEGLKYLASLGVPITDIRTAAFTSLKVSGTPTLILVNDKGVVSDVWAGKLPQDKETEVLNKL